MSLRRHQPTPFNWPSVLVAARWLQLLLGFAAWTSSACDGRAPLYTRRTPSGTYEYSNVAAGSGWVSVSPTRSPSGTSQKPHDAKLSAIGQRLAAFDHHLVEAAHVYQLPHAYLRAVAQVESRFHPQVVSRVGAMGLMQLMPFTARGMGVIDPYDPRQNALGGARLLRILANKFGGNLVLTTASYNAGAGAVKKYGGVPPYRETQRYVRRVLSLYHAYAAQTTGS